MSEEIIRLQLFGDDGKLRQCIIDEIKVCYGYVFKVVVKLLVLFF